MQQIKTKEQTNKQMTLIDGWGGGNNKHSMLYVVKHGKSTDMGLVEDAHIEMTSSPGQTTNDI